MAITDLFKPNWKHSDVSVRTKAVRGLDSSETELLIQIAETDAEPTIRELALNRVEDPEALTRLAAKVADKELAAQARQRANNLRISIAIEPDDQRPALAALEAIEDASALAEVVRRAAIPAVRKTALERVKDDRALAEVAR